MIFCKFSFSPLNKATAPCAAENAPDTPERPDNKPSHILSPRFNIFCWVVTASIASDNAPIWACNSLYLSELVSPTSSICINSSRTSRNRVRNDKWDCADFSASAATFSIFWASFSKAFDWSRNSFNICLRTAISPFKAFIRSLIARYSSSRPDIKASLICVDNCLYCVSSLSISCSCSAQESPICPNAARICSRDIAAPLVAPCKLLNSFIKSTRPCLSASSSCFTELACSISWFCASPGSIAFILAVRSLYEFSKS